MISKVAVVVVVLALMPLLSLADCPSVGSSMTMSGPCSLDNLKSNGCDPTSTLGLTEDQVQHICDNSGVTFSSITNNYYQFDKTHMDGGGHWNTGQDGIPNGLNLRTDAARIGRIAANIAPFARINWPIYSALNNYTDPVYGQRRRLDGGSLSTMDTDANYDSYMSNFNLSDATCTSNTVMCCFIKNRLSTFVGNANVCNIDLDGAKRSNHVNRGYGTYDTTTPTYCVGFTWKNSSLDDMNRFKGNALFDVAYNTVYQKGYVENIPGAPMCGCLEQMPAVTKADCRQVQVNSESYIVSVPSENELVIYPDLAHTDISYSDCASGLQTTVLNNLPKTATEMRARVSAKLVGNGGCTSANSKYLNEKFWVKSSTPTVFTTKVNTSQWTQVAGLGTYFFPVRASLDEQDKSLRALMGSKPPYPIIYRICSSCLPSHQHIYYKRLSQIPAASTGFNFLNLFLNNFTTVNSTSNPNVRGKDFQLYSSFADAVGNKNAWKVCAEDANSNYGFPSTCGPTYWGSCQWNRYNDYMCDGTDYSAWLHGFYVQRK